MDDSAPPPGFVRSLERGLAVLCAFDGDPKELTISEVAARSGLAPAAVGRYLTTLTHLGYLAVRHRRYRALPRVLELAYPYFAGNRLTHAVETELAALADTLGESCALTVLDVDEVTNVVTANARRELAIWLRVGRRLPAYCTAMGRVLLGGLPRADRAAALERMDLVAHTDRTLRSPHELLAVIDQAVADGYAVGDQEYEPGVRTIAVPVRDQRGEIVAAASVSTPTARVPYEELTGPVRERLADTVRRVQDHLAVDESIPPWHTGRHP